MKRENIQIRDPFILTIKNDMNYYMYGTTDKNAWEGKPTGFDVYLSKDLENWDGPFAVFRPTNDFWADQNFWAPEVYFYNGMFYMFASFKANKRCRGTQILISNTPRGPFITHSDGPVTPANWECLDGTLHIDNFGDPWMVFCHEWLQVQDGEICAIKLTRDLKCVIRDPILLFKASEATWVYPIAKSNSADEKNNFVTDGPFMYTSENGELLMLWSSQGVEGYAIGISQSTTGKVEGPWIQADKTLFAKDGGHGMLFKTFFGELMLTIHRPNNSPAERVIFLPLVESNGSLDIKF
ncbi:glycoside hydrolase family 43 protein [Clostridium estertheticum]|nr:glycoside hydrolase family 43 protein [Clostridium estertheticum]